MSTRAVIPDHIVGWFEKLNKNIVDFKTARHGMPIEEQIFFIRQQYVLLEIIIDVLDGNKEFIGARHDNIKVNQE